MIGGSTEEERIGTEDIHFPVSTDAGSMNGACTRPCNSSDRSYVGEVGRAGSNCRPGKDSTGCRQFNWDATEMQITHSELVLLLQDTTREGTAYLECQGCTVGELRQGRDAALLTLMLCLLSHQHSRIMCAM